MALTTPTSLEEVLMHVNREIPLVEVAKSSASYPPSDLDAALFRAQQWVFGVIPSNEEPKK